VAFEKGFFSPSRFPVASKYLALSSRSRLFAAGGIAALVVALLFLGDAFVGRATLTAGPLSEKHALFAKDCSTCHSPAHGVTNQNCESCHQKSAGERRVFSFPAHYQYRSADVERSSPKRKEMNCASCHREHQGRQNTLLAVADNKCVSCHAIGSFSRGHPEFEFITKKQPNAPNLQFQHILHVREVMDDQKLQDAEKSCLFCHTPNADGRAFQPLSYAKSCDGCHLGEREKTPFVPLRAGGRPGVVSLADIRRAGTPGSQWAEFWNAGEFTEQGGAIRKRPVYHADPWVLYNLQRIRHEVYPGAELADLLSTSADLPSEQSRSLYDEAIKTLNTQIQSLRGNPSPDVQTELATLDSLLKQVQRRVDQPYAPLDETKFAVTAGDATSAAAVQAYQPVVDSLTKPCQTCHLVENATIRRVKTDLRSLVRAEFDHRAHVIHARCLDCHNVIPIREFLADEKKKPTEAQDNSGIHNLPTIATCRSCHFGGSAPTRCASCHLFHPDKSHWANLSR
jgi:predicted CXXCH cytochrome family protein